MICSQDKRLWSPQRSGRSDMIDWLKRLRQRSKISFSKDRFHEKLTELTNHTESLHRICKHVEHIQTTATVAEATSVTSVTRSQIIWTASLRLHKALSSVWRCEITDEHFANIYLVHKTGSSLKEAKNIDFDLVWTCPAQIQRQCQPLGLAVEALMKSQAIAPSLRQMPDKQQTLQLALEETIRPSSSHSEGTPRFGFGSAARSKSSAAVTMPDLYTVPNLCLNLEHQPSSAMSGQCAGFLQKTKTFGHLIYTPCDEAAQVAKMKTLQDAVNVVKASEGLPFAEKLGLAKLLALAVLHYYSTPWLTDG